MKLALITDQHFGAREENAAVEAHQAQFYREWFFPIIDQHKIKIVVDLGDTFDRRKYVNLRSLHRCREFFYQPLVDREVELITLVGNHTAYYKDTNTINTLALLAHHYPHVTVVDRPREWHVGGCHAVLVPWITRDNTEETFRLLQSSTADTVFGHLEIRGFEMYRGMPSHHGLDGEVFKRFAQVFSGHFHHKATRGNITYLGAPYEMTWSDYDDPRGFHIFDTETGELTYYQNPFRLFHKLFYDDTKPHNIPDPTDLKGTFVKVVVLAKRDPVAFEGYISHVLAAEPADLKVVDDHHNAQLLDERELVNQADDPLTILRQCIDAMNPHVDRDSLQKLLAGVYHEALNMEDGA